MLQFAYPFILGGKPLSRYKLLLVSVDLVILILIMKEIYMSMDLQLKFDEYVRAGTIKAVKAANHLMAGFTGLSE